MLFSDTSPQVVIVLCVAASMLPAAILNPTHRERYMAAATCETEGVIRRDEAYRKDEFWKRVGWSRYSWATALRNGLKVIRMHGRVYVRGEDYFRYLDTCEPDGQK